VPTADDSSAIPKKNTRKGVKQQIAVTIVPTKLNFNRLIFCIIDANIIGI
jgi:hypothetical protein